MAPEPLGGKGGLRILPLPPITLNETSNGNAGGCHTDFWMTLTRFLSRAVLLRRDQKCSFWCVRSVHDARDGGPDVDAASSQSDAQSHHNAHFGLI